MNKYYILEEVGRGSYGIVYKAENKITGDPVAVKCIMSNGEESGIPSSAASEIALLRELKHPNIVTMHEYIEENCKVYLIFEYFAMNLREYLLGLPEDMLLDANDVCSYMHQLTSALLYCHQRRVMHRDLNPSNILVDGHGRIKLADFGMSCKVYGQIMPLTYDIVTIWYRAPEILLGSSTYDWSVDIWSLGCTFFELATKEVLFQGTTDVSQINEIFSTLGTPNDVVWPGVSKLPAFKNLLPTCGTNHMANIFGSLDYYDSGADLLSKIIVYDPSQRLTPDQILAHNYFNGY